MFDSIQPMQLFERHWDDFMERRELSDESRQEILSLYRNVYLSILDEHKLSDNETLFSEFSQMVTALAESHLTKSVRLDLSDFGKQMKKLGFAIEYENGQAVPDGELEEVLRRVA